MGMSVYVHPDYSKQAGRKTSPKIRELITVREDATLSPAKRGV
jgi:hypothetical protein